MIPSNALPLLDDHLHEFDAFLEKSSQDIPVKSLIYVFCPKLSEFDDIRSDAGVFRMCINASCIRQLCENSGLHCRIGISSIEPLFDLLRHQLNWTFANDQPKMNIDRYLELFKKSASQTPCEHCGDNIRCINHIPILRDHRFTTEASEAARIASLFEDFTTANTQLRINYLIVLVLDGFNSMWTKSRRLLEWIIHDGTAGEQFRIITVPVAKPIFQDSDNTSFRDYLESRRRLFENSRITEISGTNDSLDRLRQLTSIAVTFELMGHPPRVPFVIDGIRENTVPQWIRHGVYVMYNYARLRGILYKYRNGVRDGHYPDLKPLDRIDDGVKAKINQEMVDLLKWIERIQGMKIDLEIAFTKGKLDLWNLRQFAYDFSGQFSKYYSKKRVLTESIPINGLNADVLMAKIHVLLRVESVFLLLFKMFSILPIEKM